MSLDTLFLSGRIEIETYCRYLREFERQQRHGFGHKAYARIVNGKTYYEMSDKEDYFYGGIPMFDPIIGHPFGYIQSSVEEHCPIHDYRKDIVRGVERGGGSGSESYSGWANTSVTSWADVGGMDAADVKDEWETVLDGYLSSIEEGG